MLTPFSLSPSSFVFLNLKFKSFRKFCFRFKFNLFPSFFVFEYLFVHAEWCFVLFFSFFLQLLIGFESGTIVLWDLRAKCAELRWQSAEPLRSLGWHHEGKYFVSSHTDGSLCTWPLRPTPKPQFHSYPHGMYYNWYLKPQFYPHFISYFRNFQQIHFGTSSSSVENLLFNL